MDSAGLFHIPVCVDVLLVQEPHLYFYQDQPCFKSVVRLTLGPSKFSAENLVLQWNLQCLVKGSKITFKSQENS